MIYYYKHTTHSNTQEHLPSKIINLAQEEPPPSKKQKLSDSAKLSCRNSKASEDDAASSLEALVPPPPQTPAQDICYWNSSKAKKVFRPTPKEREALQAIESQIEILKDANEAQMKVGKLTMIKQQTTSSGTSSKNVKYFHWPLALQERKWLLFKIGTHVARRQYNN